MALAKKGGSAKFDIVLEGITPEVVGPSIVKQLAVKGFVTVNAGFEDDLLSQAAADCEELEFYQVAPEVQEGLLGQEGSGSIADLETNLEDEARSEGEALRALDNTITRLSHVVGPYTSEIRFTMTHRSFGVVHRSGEPEEEAPKLNEDMVTKWQNQFLRHRIMALIFLGPKAGSLELTPLGVEEAEPFEVKTSPGMMILLCADNLAHKYTGPSDTFCISSFFMTNNFNGGRDPACGYPMVPASKMIQVWFENRLNEIKSAEDMDDPVWDTTLSRSWQKAVNHMYHKGQMTGIGGIGSHLPTTFDSEALTHATRGGCDLAMEVPMLRWDISNWYDPDEQGWLRNKTTTKHICFCDGIDLFDNKFFSLTPNESRGFDPQNRSMLEMTYSALYMMGMSKKTVMNQHGGIYVGCGNLEWACHGGMEFGQFGGVTGSMCMQSGRISFCLGMKGPAITITSECASGMTASFLSAESVQSKGTAPPCLFSTALGVNFGLGPWDYPHLSKGGFLSPSGRCLTFNATADGYIRGDASIAISMKTTTEIVDGQIIPKDENFLAHVAGAMMSNAGHSASLTAPHGPSEQDCMTAAIKNAHLNPNDVDGVEAFGSGLFISDAIEASSLWRSHRSDNEAENLNYSACKTGLGNMVDGSGPMALIKNIWCMRHAAMTPNVHLRQCNPHMDVFEQPLNVITDCSPFSFRSVYQGGFAKGIGGTQVYVLLWGQARDDVMPPPPVLEREAITYWPGGGGELEPEMLPTRNDGYFISGSWNQYKPQAMKKDGEGSYYFTMTMGENSFEKFQIWLDGDSSRPLYPDLLRGGQGSKVLGPPTMGGGDEDTEEGAVTERAVEDIHSGLAPCWLIDGRTKQYMVKGTKMALARGLKAGAQSKALAELDVDSIVEAGTEDTASPGDTFKITFNINGKFRVVMWQKLTDVEKAPYTPGTYYVAGSFTDWVPKKMACVDKKNCVYTLNNVEAVYGDNEFQILRDNDWSQVFYPDLQFGGVAGPEEAEFAYGMYWRLPRGAIGEKFKIELQRAVSDGEDSTSVNITKEEGRVAIGM